MSKLSDVEKVETVEGVEVTRMATKKWRLDSGSAYRGSNSGGTNNLFNYLRRKCSVPIHSGMPRSPRSFNGVIESKKSAGWWNMINDRCDTSPGSLWYSHHRFRREWFFETLAQQDSSKALSSMKKNLTCQFVWISFLIIKRSVSMDAVNNHGL